MKKRVLYVFSLILYLMVACTLVSQKIEAEMTFPVTVKRFPGMSAMGGLEVPVTSLFVDEQGGEHLYEVVEGGVWDSGLRIQEFSDWKKSRSVLSVNGALDSVFVLSSSRQPAEGMLAEAVELDEHVLSRYLLVYPEGVPEYAMLPPNTQVISQGTDALLLETEDGIRPFMEHKVKSAKTETYGIPGLAGLDQLAGNGWRVFCLEDVGQFLESLPTLAILLMVLLAPLVLWLYSCLIARDAFENRAFLLVNIGIVLALLYGSTVIMGRIDLPSSLLPSTNILTLEHYRSEFSTIFSALHSLGNVSPDITGMAEEMTRRAMGYVTKGIGLIAAFLLIESLILWRRTHPQPKKRYVGKYVQRGKGKYLQKTSGENDTFN